jgi:SAM-dependent methyltransferase
LNDLSTGRPARRATVPDPQLAVLGDDRLSIDRIARITGQSPDEVLARLLAELRSLGSNVHRALVECDLPLYAWSDRLAEFYEQTDAFLYESLCWNLCGGKRTMRKWIAGFLERRFPDGARVLCFGDGLGCDSLYLTQAGHEVVYLEVSQRCREFASAIFGQAGENVHQSQSLADWPAESFDAVVCLDVLEHVPDPPNVVRQLSRIVRSGGYLLVHAPFFYLAPSVGTHLRSNLRFSGDWRQLYAPADLYPEDGDWFWNPLALRKEPSANRPHVSWAVRWGGALLRLAKYWHVPHVLICRNVFLRGDQRELLKRAASLMKTIPDSSR